MMSSGRVDEVSDVLALAAVERAERHQKPLRSETRGVAVWVVLEHLGIARRSRRARRVRARLDALVESGSLACGRRHGVVVWALTSDGRWALSQARGKREVPVLPEAPQHAVWREAYAMADAHLQQFTLETGEALVRAISMLDVVGEGSVSSDDWFEMAERLHRLCRRLVSASYCLLEWDEPEDSLPDIDNHEDPVDVTLPEDERKRRRARRTGRRNVALWQID
jgi:hypothetical protein